MPIDIGKLKERIVSLVQEAENIQSSVYSDKVKLRQNYERWYSISHQIIAAHLRNRLDDFEYLYSSCEARMDRYRGMRSYFLSSNSDTSRSYGQYFQSDFEQQIGMLQAVPEMIDLRALEVRALVTADIVDGECQ